MNSIAASANFAWSATTPTYRPRSTRDAERLVGSQLARRYCRTASTRRCSVSVAERPSFEKTDEMCFSTAPSEITRRRGDPHVRVALGHERQHLPLPCSQRVERLATTASKELSDDVGIEHGASRRDAREHASMNSLTSATRSFKR